MTTAAAETGSAEREVLRTRPGIAFVLVHRWAGYVPGLVLLAAYFFLRGAMIPPWPSGILVAALALLAARVVWMSVAWLSRQYVLTEQRLSVRAGVIGRVEGEAPLRNIQHIAMTQSGVERALGLGTIGVATAGSEGAALRLLMVPAPQAVVGAIREHADRAQTAGGSHGAGRGPRRPWVIGLAGGIGAGKSEVARILARLGCVVIDSDAEARRVMERPDIRRTLVEWWGETVLNPEGGVDRSAVAKIVFADPRQRRRLEELIHPLIKTARAEFIARAGDAPAVVVDAPLLFEAGVDAECDAVIFVDAPRELRLQRVRTARGWDEAELARREAAQMDPEQKRRRSHELIVNDGSPQALTERVADALTRIRASKNR